MPDDYKTKWEKFLQEAVREAVKEQLGYTDGELEDAEAFLAIPAEDETVSGRWEPSVLPERYHGRWGNFSYSDHAFLYDVAISLDNPDGGSL
jgi:hypothetical protein